MRCRVYTIHFSRRFIAVSRDIGWESRLFILLSVVALTVLGYNLYSQVTGYTYLSEWHVKDLIRAKFWSIAWLLISVAVVYWKRKSPIAPWLAVLAVSVYFVFLYGLLFRGTEYGLHAHWGDNGVRIAYIRKMMDYGTFMTDFYLKDLPPFYPPFWFAAMALYGKLIGIEAHQTIKFGYLIIYVVYPWLLFYSWRKVVSSAAAAAVSVATVFLAGKHLDWAYYEHMTLALFIPWWLYYFEGGSRSIEVSVKQWPFYVSGVLIGGLIFMTYYYWFFMAMAVVPVTILVQRFDSEFKDSLWLLLKHKVILMLGVAIVSSPYWLPLLWSIIRIDMHSAQNVYFRIGNTHAIGLWQDVSMEHILIFSGIFFSFFLWKHWGRGKLPYLFLGGALLLVVDRIFNLYEATIQSRKVLEYIHVFTVAPFAIGLASLFEQKKVSESVRRGIVGVCLLMALIAADKHSQIYTTEKYKIGLKQKVPTEIIERFDGLEMYGKVYLSNLTIPVCYLPMYMFIPENNMSAHTASRYAEREQFLDAASKIVEPELLAYALKYNRYSAIDFICLDVDKETGKLCKRLNQTRFNQRMETKKVFFDWDYRIESDFLPKRNDFGVYEVMPPERSPAYDEALNDKYPGIPAHLF